jgi:AcrR family transcriptional regulator
MSPVATLTDETAERRILDASDRLFYVRGIAGVGMADVRDAAGVSLRRLYALHPSKDDLVAAWLRDRHDRWMQWFADAVESRADDGDDALLATFDALDEWVNTPDYRGCAFLNSLAETSQIDDEHRVVIAAHKRSLIEYLAALAARDHPDSPDWLVPAFAVLIDGAIVQTAVFGDHSPIDAARIAAEHLLQRA